MFTDYDSFDFLCEQEQEEEEERREAEKRAAEYLSSESYKNAMSVHYSLPLDANPTKEKLARICQMAHSDDDEQRMDAAELMLGCTSSYIISVIKKRYRTYMPLHMQDMLQQGYLAVIRDIDKFDPERGTVTTFYSMRIDHEIQDYINNLHCSTPHYTSALKKIREFVAGKKAKGIKYTLLDICVETGLSMSTVLKCMRIKETKSVSVDTEIMESIKAPYKTPEETVIDNELAAYVHDLIDTSGLTPKEKIVLCFRYGIGNLENRNRSYSEIRKDLEAYGYNMTQNEIQKTIAEAENKVKVENGKKRRATACHRIRTEADRKISGDIVSKLAMLSDQEAVAEYFRTGLLYVD